jgi:hypothetical protein
VRERLQRWLGISDGEWARFAGFAACFFLLSIGIEFGRIGRDSYFLNTAGVAAIPLMYVFIAILMMATAPLYDRYVRRMSAPQMMIALQIGGAVGLGVLWLAITLLPTPPKALPYLLFPLVEAYLLFLLMHFWTFTNACFDAFEGRRLFPFISGAGLSGSLLAGLASRVFSSIIGANQLIIAWAVLLVASIPLTRSLARLNAQPRQSISMRVSDSGMRAVQEPSLKAVWSQPLLRTLTYMALPMWIIVYIIEYSYFGTTMRVFPNQNDLAGFLGIVVSAGAGIGLVLQFTVTPWMLRKFGVGTTSMVYPTTLTLGALSLLMFSLVPASTAPTLPLFGIALLVVFARLCDVSFFFSVHDAATQLLMYAVPSALRDRGRVLMSAVVAPASIAAAGGLLIYFRQLGEPTHNVAFVAVALAFLLMVVALGITPEFLSALLANLQPGATEHREQVLGEIAKLETNDARYVLMQSLSARDMEEARFAVERLFKIKDDDMIEEMLESASKMQVAVVKDIEEHMTEAERVSHAEMLRAAFAAAIPSPA